MPSRLGEYSKGLAITDGICADGSAHESPRSAGDDLWESKKSWSHMVGESLTVLELYTTESFETGRPFKPVLNDMKVSFPTVAYTLNDGPVVNESTGGGGALEAEGFLWKRDWDSVNPSPGNWKCSKPWESICNGVYIAEPSGLCDLPVISELADDILKDAWDTLWHIPVDL